MNQIDPSKYEHIINKNNNVDNKSLFKKYMLSLFFRSLVTIIFLLTSVFIYRSDNELKDGISNYFLHDDISFTKVKKLYDKYLGGILPIKNDDSGVTATFDENLSYSDSSIYYDGVRFSVDDNYLVPAIEEGMVVFIGDKDNYGYTIIVENLDGIHYWYGNISNTSLKLYDYVEKGSLIGEVKENLYMVFSENGKYLDYDEFIY